MNTPLRWTLNAAAGAAVLAAVALGLAWHADRSRRWEEPEWRDRSFVRLRGDPAAADEPSVRWVMAVHLACPHCVAKLHRAQVAWTERGWRPELVALLVDTPRRLGPSEIRGIPTAQVWWDSRGVWRRRWGHRIYGEILQFDRSGRHVRTVTAENILERSRLPEPESALAPVEDTPNGGE